MMHWTCLLIAPNRTKLWNNANNFIQTATWFEHNAACSRRQWERTSPPPPPPPPPPPCWDLMLRTPQFKNKLKNPSSPKHCWGVVRDERVVFSGTSALLGPMQGSRKQHERAIQALENPTLASGLSNSQVLEGAGGRTGPSSSLLSCPHSFFCFCFLTPAPAVLYSTQDCFTDSLIHCLALSKMHAMVWALSKVKHIHTVKCWAISGLQMGDKGRLELHSLIFKKKKKKKKV